MTMGFEYTLVHLYWTIPPAVVLTLVFAPLGTRIDAYKVLFLIGIAVGATIPWDSYLIRHGIWTYPPNVILGPTLFSIPFEEVFFFVIQTYNTSLLFLLLNKGALNPRYLVGNVAESQKLRNRVCIPVALILGTIEAVSICLIDGGEGTYLGLILLWACPFLLLLWTLAYQFVVRLPKSSTIISVVLPTIYLWVLDTVALRRGTWSIESGTKLGLCLWEGLEIEEAVFFLVTNILIVFGMVAFENALAILEAFPEQFPLLPSLPSPALLMKALLLKTASYDEDKIRGINEAVNRLSQKSRSFYLASSVFPGRLRIDLIYLYSFCRVADDLVDDATDRVSARMWITYLKTFLDCAYSHDAGKSLFMFPLGGQSALRDLPTNLLSKKPLCDLLEGFETDIKFGSEYPIQTETELAIYAGQVASTVAQACIELVFHHCPSAVDITPEQRKSIISAGKRMGIALQCVNIARDIFVDAIIEPAGRVYIPTTWLKEYGTTPEEFMKDCIALSTTMSAESTELDVNFIRKVKDLRCRMLDLAFGFYEGAKDALNDLPWEARGSMKVAIENYMEIGRVLREQERLQGTRGIEKSKATVPVLRRIWVAWNTLVFS